MSFRDAELRRAVLLKLLVINLNVMALVMAWYYFTRVRPRLACKRKRAQRRENNDEEFSEEEDSSEGDDSSGEDSSEDEESSEYEDSSGEDSYEDEDSSSSEDGDEVTSKYSPPEIGSENDAMQANVVGTKNAIETNGVDATNEPSKKSVRLSVPCPTMKQS